MSLRVLANPGRPSSAEAAGAGGHRRKHVARRSSVCFSSRVRVRQRQRIGSLTRNPIWLGRLNSGALAPEAAAFYRQLFAVRDTITQRVAGAAHITKPETEKEAEPSVHRGAAAVINGTERTFLDKYSDYF
jgi:hypothetical protein